MHEIGNSPKVVVIPPDCPPNDAKNLIEICKQTDVSCRILKTQEELYEIPLPSVLVTCRFFILDLQRLNLEKSFLYNIHSSLLPRWAGIHPVQWSIIKGDSHTGVTIHKLSEEVDDGEIVNQEPILINKNDSFLDVQHKIDNVTPVLLEKTLNGESSGIWKGNTYTRTWASRRKIEDSCFDWSISGIDLHNLIRAMTSPAHAYYEKNKEKKFVVNSQLMSGSLESEGRYLSSFEKIKPLQWILHYDDMKLKITLDEEDNLDNTLEGLRH